MQWQVDPCHWPSHIIKQIDGGQAYMYGVNEFDDIFARPVDGTGGWRHIPGNLNMLVHQEGVKSLG